MPPWHIWVSILFLLCLEIFADEVPVSNVTKLEIISVSPVAASLVAHNLPQPVKGFAVRIGVPFEITITFTRPLGNDTVIRFGVHDDMNGVMPLPVISFDGSTYVFALEVPLEAMPGTYDNVFLYVGNSTSWGTEYHFPEPIQVVDYIDMKEPTILRIHVVRNFLFKRHGTADYRIPLGLAVRRGESFLFRVTMNKKLHGTHRFKVYLKGHPQVKFHVNELGRLSLRYDLCVETDVEMPIGKYIDLWIGVLYTNRNAHGNATRHYTEFLFPWPLYVVFNAYNVKETIFLKDTEVRQEYLENEHGLVFNGPMKHYEAIPWYYGQYSQQSLDAAFYLLEKCSPDYTSPLKVAQCLASRIVYRGDNEDGVLWPRWAPVFPDGVEPDEWSSSDGIIQQWAATNHTPVKYGQCWVIASIICALLRALGIPTRQVVAFGAVQDDSDLLDPAGLPHHAVLNYYLKDGRLVTQIGRVWRFHSFVDLWMRRDDLPSRYSGWQGLDATIRQGKGLGPASVRAIYELRYELPYNVTNFVSGLHSVVRNILLECDKTLPVSPRISITDVERHCVSQKTIKVKKAPVPLVVTTAVGKYKMLDITHQYVDPNVEAEIPGIPLLPDPVAPIHTTLTASLVKSHVQKRGNGLVIYARVMVAEAILQPEEVDVSIISQLVYPDGRLYTEIHRKSSSVRLQPRAQCTAELDFHFRLPDIPHHFQNARFIEIRVLAVARNSGGAAMDKSLHRLP